MKVGDRTSEWVHFGEVRAKRMTGTVEYIHPARRFYVVRFETEIGSFTESYLFPGHGRIANDEKY